MIASELLNDEQTEFLNFIHKSEFFDIDIKNFNTAKLPNKISEIYKKTQDNSIFQLFPYVHLDHDSDEVLNDIKESINNLKTRLSNLKKINKSLNEFGDDFTSLNWEDLKSISFEFKGNKD